MNPRWAVRDLSVDLFAHLTHKKTGTNKKDNYKYKYKQATDTNTNTTEKGCEGRFVRRLECPLVCSVDIYCQHLCPNIAPSHQAAKKKKELLSKNTKR